LREETAKDIRQETAKILVGWCTPTDSLAVVEMKSRWALEAKKTLFFLTL
jgi:hypothetical protein